MGDQVSAEQQYVDSVKEVIEALKETQAGGEVIMTLASIWAQHKAGELTALNVVRGQMEGKSDSAPNVFQQINEMNQQFAQFLDDREA